MTSKLKKFRQAADLTQKELADKTGINIRQIQKYESGEYALGNMTAKTLLAISDALGVDPHVLIQVEK